MNAADSPKGVKPEEHTQRYHQCMRLLKERDALPWWRWRRFNAINREVRAILASMEDDS